jgi:RHS repeat-associated protein
MVQADISTPEVDQQGDVIYTNETSTNAYNASGQRVNRVENGETTKYYYSGSAILYTTNENNWLTTENLLAPGGQIIASARFDDHNPNTQDPYADKYFFYHYDMRGSTTAIVQPDGSLIKGYSYDEFGKLESSGASDFLNDVTFTGSVSDMATGLQYMNARFYNPNTGRFLSQDSYSGNPYDPWTQHLYAYTANNPVNFIDPTGHSIQSLQNELDELKRQRKIRIQFRDGYRRMMNEYAAEGNWEMYDLVKGGWLRNRQIVKDLNAKIIPMEKELAALKDLQYKIDNGQYDQIDQHDYEDLPLFDDNNVSDNGCGMIAAIIAASKLDAKIDVHDAYLYFNKPENELFDTGAFHPAAVSGYLMEQGYYPEGGSYDMEADSVYITYFAWKSDISGVTYKGWHYMCLTTDANGDITGYNRHNQTPYQSYGEFANDHGATFTPGLAIYRPF